MTRRKTGLCLRLLPGLVLAAVVVACTDVSTPPSEIVAPEIVGHWASQDEGSPPVIHLDTGQAVVFGPQTFRLALANGGAPTSSTLMMFGHETDGYPWFVRLDPSVTRVLPGGAGPCYGLTGNAYDDGDSVVIRVPPDQTTNRSTQFGIRLPKAPSMTSPNPSTAPWYGLGAGFCIDNSGHVALLAP